MTKGKGGGCFLLMTDDTQPVNAYPDAVGMDFSAPAFRYLPEDVVACMQGVGKLIGRGSFQAAVTQVEELRARLFEHGISKGCMRRAWAKLIACERGVVRRYLERNATALMEP